jgi:hypothetical protein
MLVYYTISCKAPSDHQHLSFRDCVDITDAVVTALVQGCAQLISIYLRDCVDITDAVVTALVQGCA